MDGSNGVWYGGWNTSLVGKVGGSTVNDTISGARPNGIAYDPATGHIGFADFEGGYFQVVDPSGPTIIQQVQLNATSNTLPCDVVYADGYAWVSAFGTGQVFRIDSGGTITSISVGANPLDLFAASGKIYVANSGGDSLSIIDTSTLGVTTVSLGSGSAPYSAVVGPDGNAWVALSGTSQVARVTPAGRMLGEYTIASGATGTAA